MTSSDLAGATPWLNDEQQRVWRQWLFVTARLPAVLNTGLVASSGISLQDFEVLVGLSESEGQRARIATLARTLQWERSRLSHHVARMVKRDLVAREECCNDARGSWVVLTENGRGVLGHAAERHVRHVREVLIDLLPERDLKALDRITARMQRYLEDEYPL